MQKNILVLALFLIISAGVAAIFVAQQQTAHPPITTVQTHAADSSSTSGRNVTFTVTEAEHKKWELLVSRALYFEDRSGANLMGVQGRFFDANGNAVASFSAPRGVFLNAKKSVVLTGGVVVTSADKDKGTLHADKMTWSTVSKQILAEDHVKLLMSNDLSSTADRCRFSLDFTNIQLEGNASSNIKL